MWSLSQTSLCSISPRPNDRASVVLSLVFSPQLFLRVSCAPQLQQRGSERWLKLLSRYAASERNDFKSSLEKDGGQITEESQQTADEFPNCVLLIFKIHCFRCECVCCCINESSQGGRPDRTDVLSAERSFSVQSDVWQACRKLISQCMQRHNRHNQAYIFVLFIYLEAAFKQGPLQ